MATPYLKGVGHAAEEAVSCRTLAGSKHGLAIGEKENARRHDGALRKGLTNAPAMCQTRTIAARCLVMDGDPAILQSVSCAQAVRPAMKPTKENARLQPGVSASDPDCWLRGHSTHVECRDINARRIRVEESVNKKCFTFFVRQKRRKRRTFLRQKGRPMDAYVYLAASVIYLIAVVIGHRPPKR